MGENGREWERMGEDGNTERMERIERKKEDARGTGIGCERIEEDREKMREEKQMLEQDGVAMISPHTERRNEESMKRRITLNEELIINISN